MLELRTRILAPALIAVLACSASADKGNAPTASSPATPAAPSSSAASSPDARGRAILKQQLASLADEDGFAASFTKDATVLTPLGSSRVHAPNASVASAVAFLNPHAQVKKATFDHYTSGGNSQVAWFAADLQLTIVSHEPGGPPSTEKHTVRAIELIDGAASWNVAVAAFTNVGPLATYGTSTINDPTDAGPLTKLLVAPETLAGNLADGAVVFGTEPKERGVGTTEAKALLARWKKLTITLDTPSTVHEVRTGTYGYAIANVSLVTKPGAAPYKLNAFVLALPAAGNRWSVVGASYGALF